MNIRLIEYPEKPDFDILAEVNISNPYGPGLMGNTKTTFFRKTYLVTYSDINSVGWRSIAEKFRFISEAFKEFEQTIERANYYA